MNTALKLLASQAQHLHLLKFRHGQICQIHNWVRPVRNVLYRRRKVEHEKFPERAQPQRRSGFSDWNYRAELYAFGKRLGEDFDESLLMQAFIDKSYIHSERQRKEELGLDTSTMELADNSDLAGRGRALIEQSLKSFLHKEFPRLPKEGVDAVVQCLISPPILGKMSSLLGTKDLIQCTEYPPTDQIFATVLEAVVGALEQSSGVDKGEKFIVDFIASHLCGKDIHDFWDIPKPWHMLLDITRPLGKSLEPRLIREAGRNTLLSAFVVGVYDEKKVLLGTGIGETIDIAQEMAARDVLRTIFGTKCPITPFQFQSSNFPPQLIPHVRNG